MRRKSTKRGRLASDLRVARKARCHESAVQVKKDCPALVHSVSPNGFSPSCGAERRQLQAVVGRVRNGYRRCTTFAVMSRA